MTFWSLRSGYRASSGRFAHPFLGKARAARDSVLLKHGFREDPEIRSLPIFPGGGMRRAKTAGDGRICRGPGKYFHLDFTAAQRKRATPKRRPETDCIQGIV
jgi:hypothetical protein